MNKDEIFKVLYDKEKWEVYRKFQEIEANIDKSNHVYTYIDDIIKMLADEKLYIRVRAFRILCRLSKWDIANKINTNIDSLLAVLDNDKPTSVRQCLAALNILLLYKKELFDRVKDKLEKTDYSKYKDSMSPLIKKDIDNILG